MHCCEGPALTEGEEGDREQERDRRNGRNTDGPYNGTTEDGTRAENSLHLDCIGHPKVMRSLVSMPSCSFSFHLWGLNGI